MLGVHIWQEYCEKYVFKENNKFWSEKFFFDEKNPKFEKNEHFRKIMIFLKTISVAFRPRNVENNQC